MSRGGASGPAGPDLAGRVVLVTGATGGLGRATALACADAGATLVLLARHRGRLERLHDEIAARGGQAWLQPMDLAGAGVDDHARLAAQLADGPGRLDGIVHCAAAFAGMTPLALADPLRFARELHVNLTARAWLTRACLPLLEQGTRPAALFVMDDPSRMAQAYWCGYGVAQDGQRALLATWSAELRHSPVRLLGVRPGPMRTALHARAFAEPLAEAVDPAVRAPAIVSLLGAADPLPSGDIRSFPP